MMLHYVWQHKTFPLKALKTTDGREVEVISVGMHNTDAGPDFLNAKVKIDGVLWVGSVEIHTKSSDWYRHRHDSDAAYDSVILHVTGDADMEVTCSNGVVPPQLVLPVPESVRANYEALCHSDCTPRCREVIADIPRLMQHNWLTSLFVERLELRTRQIMERRELCDKNWEDTMFVTIARNFGFGINGEAFERWAHSIPMGAVAKHRNDLFQVEAIFFGQAGLLEDSAIPSEYLAQSAADGYLLRLRSEYEYMRKKFGFSPMDSSIWRFLRLRPQNFPHIRIAQLAMMYYEGKVGISALMNAETLEGVYDLFDTHVSQYWRTHYTFASTTSPEIDKKLSNSSKELLVINSVAPMLFAYGRYKSDEALEQRAMNYFEQLRPENNRIIRDWQSAGIRCESAADSQALIQLTKQYCMTHDCLRCRFGNEFIRRNPGFLKEEGE